MALVTSIVLALFVVPAEWRVPVVLAGVTVEVAEAAGGIWWSRRRRARVGAEAMVGARAVVLEGDWVRVAGERWRARGDAPLVPGATVVVEAVDGLTLVVREP